MLQNGQPFNSSGKAHMSLRVAERGTSVWHRQHNLLSLEGAA